MEGKEQASKGDESVWWEQGDVTQCQDFSTVLVKLNVAVLERAPLPLPLQSKWEEECMGRRQVRLWRSCLHLLPTSPQAAAASPSILVAAASSDSSCFLQTSAPGSASCAWRRLLFAESGAQCRAPAYRTKSLQNFRWFCFRSVD